MERNVTLKNKSDKTHGSHIQGKYDIIVFCHLRWDFVFQRPQQLITRLSNSFSILFIEEPIPYSKDERNTANIIRISDNITVLQPKVDTIEEIGIVLKKYTTGFHLNIGWFYSAAFVPLLEFFEFDKVIYDCMDELSLFKGAPQQLITQEKELLAHADIVFTGGKSLYESKLRQHANTYCFMSSVDSNHFDTSLKEVEIPEDLQNLPKPIIGYYGVIDERIDYGLLKQTAADNPDCSFVMIGPLAKVEEQDLPKSDNLHFLGMRSYAELPAYLKGFDIAMMPFALNDSTKYISPTKTLEYMAGDKPIISTPIHDVVRDYRHCIEIVNTPDKFSKAIKSITTNKVRHKAAYSAILNATSWDATAFKMKELILEKSIL